MTSFSFLEYFWCIWIRCQCCQLCVLLENSSVMQTVVMVYLHLRLVELDSIAIVWMIAIIFVQKKRNISKMGSVHILPFLLIEQVTIPIVLQVTAIGQLIDTFSLGTIAGEPNNFQACSHDMSHAVLIPSKFCVPCSPPPPRPISLGPANDENERNWTMAPDAPPGTANALLSPLFPVYLWLFFIFDRRRGGVT